MIGKDSFNNSATIKDPSPEKNPLKITTEYVFLLDKFLVQLFSNPQHKVANSTNIEPKENLKDDISSKDKTKLDNVINVWFNNKYIFKCIVIK